MSDLTFYRASGPAGPAGAHALRMRFSARFPTRDPALLVDLLAARDRQRAGRHVLGDRRAGGDVRARADADGRDQLLSLPMNAPSSITVGCFVRAVVVARDRAGADVDLLADRRVAEIGRWLAFDPRPSIVFFSSTKLPTCASSPTCDCGRRCANGPTCAPPATCESMITQKLLMTTPSSIVEFDDADAGVDLAAASRCACAPRETRRDG